VPGPPAASPKRWTSLKRTGLLAALLLAVLAGAGVVLGSGGTAAVAQALDDPLSLFADRSPGGRGEGALFLTKRKIDRPAKSAAPAREESLEPVALQVAEAALAEEPAAEPVILLDDSAPAMAFLTPPGAMPLLAAGTPFRSGGGGILGGAGSRAPSSDAPGELGPPEECCGEDSPAEETQLVESAVPEPATWVMMIGGFFMVGAALRSSAKRAARRAA